MCALMNSTEGAQAVCSLYHHVVDFSLKDGDGRTAFDVAIETEVQGVVDVIKSYCDDEQVSIHQKNTAKKGSTPKIDDDEDFVYDLYCLDYSHSNRKGNDSKIPEDGKAQQGHDDKHQRQNEGAIDVLSEETNVSGSAYSIELPGNRSYYNNNEATIHRKNPDDSGDSDPVVVNMRGGVGYWVDGELVLDMHQERESDESQMEDDEYDSNREDCDANEYPDEDDSDGYYDSVIHRGTGMTPPRFMNGLALSPQKDSDDDDYVVDMPKFRNRPIDLSLFEVRSTRNQFGGYFNDDDDEDDTGSNDENRGFMCRSSNSWSNERIYCETEAYDPDINGEDS